MKSQPHRHPDITPERRKALVRRVRFLVLFTISYNIVEAIVAIIAGGVTGSGALIGFGLDSVIEVLSAVAVAWQFASDSPEKREKTALRVVSVSLFGLAVFISCSAISSLLMHKVPESSPVGVIVAILSLLIMPAVSRIQRNSGQELGSHSAIADSKQTLLCTYMSAILLFGLVANGMAGCWWADPLAALAIAGIAAYEGLKAWKGHSCTAATGVFFERKQNNPSP